jgi:DNA-binding SARP family transcriptional activator
MLTIRLLGRPTIERDDQPVRSPRGRKAWALLAYVLLAERPPSRRTVAELLFRDADDPLGALRWTLAELRRALGLPDSFSGDPVLSNLGQDVTVDIEDPETTSEGELLDGVELPSSLEFESWLLVARHRVSAAQEARVREIAVGLLATGHAGDAVAYASRAVARNPYEEGNHELLVRCLAAAGDRAAARRQVAVCEDLFRRELGTRPSPALREAADIPTGSPMALPLGGRAAAASQLDAGRAAIVAGAVDAGLQSLRRAVVEAERSGDTALHGRALTALGSALIHAARGRDEEGSVVLHEAIAVTKAAGDRATAVTAHRELGFVEVQAGRRTTADAWLGKAHAMAETDEEIGAILAVRGQNASDRGDYPGAFDFLREGLERSERSDDRRQQAWTLSMVGRAHLLRAEHSQATVAVARSLELIREQRWMALLPWSQTLQAELDLIAGDVDRAANGLEQAWVLGCQLNDPCWEGMAARGLGLLQAHQGDQAAAVRWLGEAATRSSRVSDRYQWVFGHVLDASAGAAIDQGDEERGRALVTALGSLAARCDMRELVARAHLHRGRLGDTSAVASARLLAADIDNPALAGLMRAA